MNDTEEAQSEYTVEEVLDAIDEAGYEVVEYIYNNEGGKDAWRVEREKVEDRLEGVLND